MYIPEYDSCHLCPRNCGVARNLGRMGYCHAGSEPYIARAALHPWEEPCLTGEKGSGTVFFTGCNLRCVFCQNHEISAGKACIGEKADPGRLAEMFVALQEEGAANINLVTADPHIPIVARAVELARKRGLSVPVLFNTSSYLNVETVRSLEGIIDIYMPDRKYRSSEKAGRYLGAPDYPEKARLAIAEMVRQQGQCVFNEEGILQKGVIIRHLLMPRGLLEAKLIIKELYESYGDRVWFSLLRQYTPIAEKLTDYPEINRPVTEREYIAWTDYAWSLGIRNAYIQEGGTVSESFIPEFGVVKCFPRDEVET